MKDLSETYIVKHLWMVEKLGIKGRTVDAFALIYGFSQDQQSEFTGSISYVARWLGCSRNTAIKSLKELVEKQLVKKRIETINGVKFGRYMVNFDQVKSLKNGGSAKTAPPVQGGEGSAKNALGVVQKMHQGSAKNALGGSAKTAPNNTNIDNTNDSIVRYPSKSDFEKSQMDLENGNDDQVNTDQKKEKNFGKKEKDSHTDQAVQIMQYFNEATGQDFSCARSGRGSKNVAWVRALIKKGYTPDELRAMIDMKAYEWGQDQRMRKYLVPVTIFKRHGEEYTEIAIQAIKNGDLRNSIQYRDKTGRVVDMAQRMKDQERQEYILKNW